MQSLYYEYNSAPSAQERIAGGDTASISHSDRRKKNTLLPRDTRDDEVVRAAFP